MIKGKKHKTKDGEKSRHKFMYNMTYMFGSKFRNNYFHKYTRQYVVLFQATELNIGNPRLTIVIGTKISFAKQCYRKT